MKFIRIGFRITSLLPLIITTCFVSFINNFTYSQNNFEMLIPWENDTMTQGLFAKETPDGNYMVLTANNYFPPDPGFPVSGTLCYGTGLIKVSKTGQILWKKLYNTSYYDSPLGDMSNFPPALFFIAKDSQLIIPFKMAIGNVVCADTNTSGPTWDTGVLLVNTQTGEEIHKQLFYDDGLCTKTAYNGFGLLNDSVIIALESRNSGGELFFVTRNMYEPSVISEYYIPSNTKGSCRYNNEFALEDKRGIFFKEDTSFLIVGCDSFGYFAALKISYDGKTEKLIPYISFYQTIYFDKCFYSLENYRYNDKWYIAINKYNKDRTLIKKLTNQITGPGVDFSITKDGEIILLSWNPEFFYKGFKEDKPIRILLLDTAFNVLGYRDFGFQYVTPYHISSTTDNGFVVTGSRNRYWIDPDSTKDPTQVYFLKYSLDSINISWTSVNVSIKEDFSYTVFPNPVFSEFNLTIGQISDKRNYLISLNNMLGQTILQQKANSGNNSFDIHSIQVGLYFLSIEEINLINLATKKQFKITTKILKLNN